MPKLDNKGRVTIPRSDEIEFVLDGRSFRVRRRVEGSPFAAYRGYLRELEGQDPDELVNQMRGAVNP